MSGIYSTTSIGVELGNVDFELELSDDSQHRLSDPRGKQHVGVSDDAFDRH